MLDEHEIEALIGPSINRRSETNGQVDIAPGGPVPVDRGQSPVEAGRRSDANT